jgi:hypothetical protein
MCRLLESLAFAHDECLLASLYNLLNLLCTVVSSCALLRAGSLQRA